MRFLVDAQLPRRLARWLSDKGYETVHTLEPHKLIFLTTGNISTNDLINVFELNLDSIISEISNNNVVEISRTSIITID